MPGNICNQPLRVEMKKNLNLFLVLALLCSIGCQEFPQTQINNEKIIVIGAGIAGLAAAKKLQDSGHEVFILEARNRIGGRIHTDRSLGYALDMGASWIHGIDDNPIYELALESRAPLSRPTDYDNHIIYDVEGDKDPISTEQSSEFLVQVGKRSLQWGNEKRFNKSMGELIASLRADGKLDFINNSRELDYLSNVVIEHEYAGAVEGMSAIQASEGEDLEGDDVVFPNGYDQLTEHLAKNLDIRLQQVVNEIKYDASGVTVITSQGSFTGDRVVVTLPIGVLRAGSVQFTPSLPKTKLQAIQAIGSGTLNKVWMHFAQAFWDTNKDVIGYVSEPKGQFSEFFYFPELKDGKVLIGFNAGSYGEAIEALSDEQIIDHAMATLTIMYGTQIPRPDQYKISRWHSDPYAKGSYGYLRVGAKYSHREKLRENVAQRLFFAGEATSADYAATTEGAYRTGLQAAAEIIGAAN